MTGCCCDCFLDLGCIECCINTGLKATQKGIHTLKYKFNSTWLRVDSAELEIGDDIEFDLSTLVANYHYQAIIEDPYCEEVPIIKDTIPYDCLKFYLQFTQQ